MIAVLVLLLLLISCVYTVSRGEARRNAHPIDMRIVTLSIALTAAATCLFMLIQHDRLDDFRLGSGLFIAAALPMSITMVTRDRIRFGSAIGWVVVGVSAALATLVLVPIGSDSSHVSDFSEADYRNRITAGTAQDYECAALNPSGTASVELASLPCDAPAAAYLFVGRSVSACPADTDRQIRQTDDTLDCLAINWRSDVCVYVSSTSQSELIESAPCGSRGVGMSPKSMLYAGDATQSDCGDDMRIHTYYGHDVSVCLQET